MYDISENKSSLYPELMTLSETSSHVIDSFRENFWGIVSTVENSSGCLEGFCKK